MTETVTSEWLKGGIRYAKLKDIVAEYVAPESVKTFFVAVGRRGNLPRLLNPFSPLQREYVVAVTEGRVFVLKLRRPGVFRASIAGAVLVVERSEVAAKFEGGRVVLNGFDYWPISFHDEDAETLVSLVQG